MQGEGLEFEHRYGSKGFGTTHFVTKSIPRKYSLIFS